MRPVFIYALLDPVTEIVRYVGQTIQNPDRRLRRHLAPTPGDNCHAACWVRSLLNQGSKPIMEILDVVPDSEADFWEREYIQNFRERGFDLTNFSDGGNAAMRGKKLTLEHRTKISLAHKGKIKSKAHLAAISLALTGTKLSPERVARHAAKMRGKKQSPEHVASRTAKITGLKRTLEFCEAVRIRGTGKKHSPEAIAKMSATKKAQNLSGEKNPFFGKKHTPETRAKMSAARTLYLTTKKRQAALKKGDSLCA